MRHRKLGLLFGLALIAFMGVAVASAATAPSADPTEIKAPAGPDAATDRQVPGNQSPAHLPTTAAPRPAPLTVAPPGSEFGTNFAGLTFHNQRRDADGGNQLSLEPPDQGLCVGNGEVIEPINDLFTTNDGRNGEQTHPGCPCFGDQPLLGIDANGVYITTNEFPINGPGFNGAQIYAIQKSALIAGTTPNVQRFEGTQGPVPFASTGYGNGIPYSLEPALSPSAADFATANSGTEYLFGALEFGKKPFQLDNRLAVWALTNTASLTSAPDIHIKDAIVNSEVYGFPPSIVQPNGPTPLAD